MNRKGFTLIELIAVIIILGVIMVIAIPSISKSIENARKNAYVDIANLYVNDVRTKVSSNLYKLKKDGTVYYIPIDIIHIDGGTTESPYGEWAKVDQDVRYLAYDDDDIQKCASVAQTSVTATGDATFSIYNNKTAEYESEGRIKKVTQGCIPKGTINEAFVVVRYDKSTEKFIYSWTSRDVTGHTIMLENIDTIDSKDVVSRTLPILGFSAITKKAVKDPGGTTQTFNYDEVSARSGYANSRITLYYPDKDLSGGAASLTMTREEAIRCFVYYKVTDTTVGIESYNKECGTDVEIPSEIDGMPVVEIGQYAFYNMGITSVVIHDGVTRIRNSAFRNNAITSIVFPSNPITIESWAFYSNSIDEIALPRNSTLGGGAFSGNLFDEDKAFIYNSKSDGTVDYTYLIGYAGTSKYLNIPDSVNGVALLKIGGSAFRGLGITGVHVPSTVTTIESWAFASNSLTSFDYPPNLKTIGGAAFASNKLTTTSDIPSTVTSIGTRSYNNNQVQDGTEFVYARKSDGTVDYSNIVSYAGKKRDVVTIPGSKNGVALKTISGSSFLGCSIKKFSAIPDSVTSIGIEAFNSNQTSGEDDQFIYGRKSTGGPDYTKLVGYAGSKRTDVVIPQKKNGVQLLTIVNQAFGEDGLKSVTIPEGVTKIENNAFRYNYLTTVTIPSTVTSIGTNAFCKEVSWGNFNRLTNIYYKGSSTINWANVTCSKAAANFVTGTIDHQLGAILVSKN